MPEGVAGAVSFGLVGAGLALCFWALRRERGGRSVLGSQPVGELPDTRVALALGVVLWFGAQIVTVGLLRPEPGVAQAGVVLTLTAMQLAAALLVVRFALGGTRPPAVGRVRLAALACGGGLVTYAVAGVTSFLVVQGYGLAGAEVPTQRVGDLVAAASGPELAALIGSAVVCAPLAEEILFRGLLFPALAKVMPLRVALVVQALLFGFFHFFTDPAKWALSLPLAAVGLCAGWLYHRTGSLWAAAGLHAAYNAIQIGFLIAG